MHLLLMLTVTMLIPNVALALSTSSRNNTQDPANSNVSFNQKPELANVSSPAFSEYRGVRIGMSESEVREKLGKPKIEDKSQDLFAFGDNESAQVFYDAQQKVYAISIDFSGKKFPTPREILGEDITVNADGSMYLMKRYLDAGYWVSYNRTSSALPQVSVTIQRIGN
ncbi:MAG TPA: hypothetical protein VLA93_18965 [Pyrinomonadaceae bacterium]|nr:hypothetical protein [Pyrinomonadaceae bacterium]